ncbi:MAG: Ig-like domain-containing protein [Candidatus Hodarchaeales archaeon]
MDTDYSVTDWGFKIDYIEYEGGTADTTAPTVSITSPADGATVSGTVTVEASASDNVGVDRVEFFVDGEVNNYCK